MAHRSEEAGLTTREVHARILAAYRLGLIRGILAGGEVSDQAREAAERAAIETGLRDGAAR